MVHRSFPMSLLAVLLVPLVILLGGVFSSPAARGDDAARDDDRTWRLVREHWYVLRLAGVDCGWMRTTLRDDGARYRTETEMSLRIDRGGEPVEVATRTEFEETHRGEPLRLRIEQRMGVDPVDTTYLFDDPELAPRGRVRRISRQSGVETIGDEPRPAGEWLPPAAADRFFAKRRDAGAKEVVHATIDGQTGLQVATVRAVRDGEERVEIDGRELPVTRWRIATSAVPVVTVALLDVDGVPVRSRVDLGFGELETRLATEAEVRRLQPGRLPDLIVSTMVRPDRPIASVARTTEARFRLRLPDGASMPDLPVAGAQRVERVDARTAIVHVDRARPAAAPDADREDEALRGASPTVDIDDPLIRTLHGRAVRGLDRATPVERAEAMRRFVDRHVRNKGLDVAFATASEVARRGEGDCSEHAVLLCALLRVDGIPARIASGLIYVDDFAQQRAVFGWHMWTQALLEFEVDGTTAWRWIDLDATLPGTAHAAYILTGVSTLAHGPSDPAMTAMLPLLGRLAIEVIDVRHEQPAGTRPRPTGRSSRPRRRRAPAMNPLPACRFNSVSHGDTETRSH